MLIKTEINLIKAVQDLKIVGRVTLCEKLKNHTTLRIGGPAEIFIQPLCLEDLRKVVTFARKNNIFLFILGGGSKVLIPDEGMKGITLKLDTPFFKKISFCNNYVKLGCGVKVNEFLNWMLKNSFGGWEFLAGIPASIGGLLIMNAGVRESPISQPYIQIGDFVEEVTVMDNKGDVLTLTKNNLKFNYRQSNLFDYIILEVKLSGVVRKNEGEIQKNIKRFVEYRRETQELEFPNAGCVFKNPIQDSRSSGELIEFSGLKDRRIGDILVSNKHANFILNVGEGRAIDFLNLMDLIQKKVKFDHNIWLEPEIKIIKNEH